MDGCGQTPGSVEGGVGVESISGVDTGPFAFSNNLWGPFSTCKPEERQERSKTWMTYLGGVLCRLKSTRAEAGSQGSVPETGWVDKT